MSLTKPKSAFLTVRVTGSTRAKFHAKAAEYGQPTGYVLRELVEAFIEGRLVIHPPLNKKESLYVARSKD